MKHNSYKLVVTMAWKVYLSSALFFAFSFYIACLSKKAGHHENVFVLTLSALWGAFLLGMWTIK